ncbi:MAG TPA: hypothetical protein VGD74_02940 [Vulgatibacter sp.]
MTARYLLACLALALPVACTTTAQPPDTPLTCQGSSTACGEACVETSNDPSNCGGCGVKCGADQVCAEGTCAPGCLAGQIVCEGKCVSPQGDPKFCGARGDCVGSNAGWVCEAWEVCADGACWSSCPEADQIVCNGSCVTPATDRLYCGAQGDCRGANVGVECPLEKECVDGACELICPAGRLACDGICISPLTNRHFCGAIGDCRGVNAGEECMEEEICDEGTCVRRCPVGQIQCDGGCVDPSSNRRFCGATGDCAGKNAGTTCSETRACVQGACVAFVCESNEDCDDGLFCTGVEACDPEDPESDDFGCRPGQLPCYATEICDEASHTCHPGG